MATRSWLLTVSVLIEQDEETLRRNGWRTDDEFQRAVTDAIAALYAGRSDTAVEWQSLTSTPLDGKPAVGRCLYRRLRVRYVPIAPEDSNPYGNRTPQ
jgi:hypothetical protein